MHTLAVALLLEPEDIHFFREIGYAHTGIQHCPADAESQKKCRCDPEDDWAGRAHGHCYSRFRRCFFN